MNKFKKTKLIYFTFIIFLLLSSIALSDQKITYRNSSFKFRFQVPSNWKEVDIRKIETDVNPNIVFKAFKPTPESLLIVTAQKTDFSLATQGWLPFLIEPFKDEKTLTIIKSEIKSFGKNTFASLVVKGKGTGTTLFKGDIDTIKHIYLISNGEDLIFFVLIAPEKSYNSINKVLTEQVLNTLVFEQVKIAKLKEIVPVTIGEEATSKPQEQPQAPKPEEKPAQPQPVTKPEVPVVKPEIKELAPSDILALKQNISNLGFILLFPQGKSFADFALLLPSNDFKASFVKIIVPQVIKSTDGSEQIIWLIPRNLVDTEITDLLMIMLPDQKVAGLVPLKLIKPYLDPYNDQFLQLLADKKIEEEGITIKEYISKNSIIKF